MININKSTLQGQIAIILGLASLVLGMAACSKMDSTYYHFWKNGEKIYPASPDSILVYSGRNQIQLSLIIVGDPSVSVAKIYWNNETDSVEVPVQREEKSSVDTIKVTLKSLPEGNYSFNIYMYDDKGNRSVVANAVGHSYGSAYISSLLNRLIKSASFANGETTIVWGDPVDKTSKGTEVAYKDTTGVLRYRFISSLADSTFINDFAFTTGSTIQYRTLYVPDTTSVDTFYAAYDTVKVLGPRTVLSKSGWTATASSYDQRYGTARAPQAAIDNNIATIWVNQISPQTHFPHIITVDMGSVQDNIYGISFYLDKRNETPKSVDIYISNDGANWQLLGLFTLQNEAGIQYVDFPQPESLQYFRVKTEQPQGNTPNIVIPEVGVFTR